MKKGNYLMLLISIFLLIIGVIIDVNLFTLSSLFLLIILFICLILKEKKNEK